VAVSAGTRRSQARQERRAAARRPTIGRRHDAGRLVPARQRPGVGWSAVRVFRQPPRHRGSGFVSAGPTRGLLGRDAADVVVSIPGQCCGLYIT
jgi:hypothetical protein